MAENKFREKEKAVTLIKLLEDNSDYPMKYYIDATKHYENFEDALKFLNQPCPICTDTFIMDDVSLTGNLNFSFKPVLLFLPIRWWLCLPVGMLCANTVLVLISA